MAKRKAKAKREHYDAVPVPAQTSAPAEVTELAAAARAIVAVRRCSNENGAPLEATPEGLALIEKLAAAGLSDAGIAAVIRAHRNTFREIRRRQPEVDEALERGRATLEYELEHHLLAAARRGEWPAALALGKVRLGWKEGVERDVVVQTNVQIVLPGAAPSIDAYERELDVAGVPRALPEGDGEVT